MSDPEDTPDRPQADADTSVTEQDDELGLRENELLPNGDALHDANQDVDPADQHDDAPDQDD